MKIDIDILKKRENAVIPEKSTEGSAGFDLYACIETEELEIKPHKTLMIPTGIAISMSNKSCTAFIFARSGLSSKHGICLANGVGVVDNDYRGEIIVPLHNISEESYVIKNKDRIAQLVVMSVCDLKIRETSFLGQTERNEDGFGSTGK